MLVSSFNRSTVGKVKSSAPDIPTGQLLAPKAAVADWIGTAAGDSHQWFLPYRRYLKEEPAMIDAAHTAGMQIGVWTVDSPKWLQSFADAGVNAIITNRPARAVALYAG